MSRSQGSAIPSTLVTAGDRQSPSSVIERQITASREEGGPVGRIDESQHFETALHMCATVGRASIVRLLLLYGADVGKTDAFGRTALICAAGTFGNAEIVGLLLAAGADINAKDSRGRTSLFVAASVGDESTVRLLLEHGADVNGVLTGHSA